MSEVVIRVENLYKEYRLGTISHGTLSRDLQSWWANLRGKEDPNSLISSSYSVKATDINKRFYALKDISFDVKQGEIVGIIGRNGAGKSTLLKIMSKVTAPTRGTIKVKGRIASLLEIGTGFHPELTGRENIYLNGTILGMKRKEIDTKYEEIVDFAELEEFIDTPVKRYSSGMYVRLAFAVAAHLEPEILIVDEVLAVGDIAFQKKCLGKMKDVAKEGRTVLFVSHNMSTITSLCPHAILLESGQIVFKGKTSDVVLYYLTNGAASPESVDFSKGNKRIGNDYVVLLSGSIISCNDELISEVDINEAFKICMKFKILKETKRKFVPQVHFFTSSTHVFVEYYQTPLKLSLGKYEVEFTIPANFLNDLTYFVSLGMASIGLDIKLCFYEENALSFNVRDSIENTPGPRRAGYMATIPGQIRPQFEWTIRKA